MPVTGSIDENKPTFPLALLWHELLWHKLRESG
jgi:hypothetical protein